jgi:dTDP-3-amino-3,4,6-trideoxy-alpha-D-glucose transaminase
MAVPFIDLTREIAAHRDAYLAIAARVIDSGVFRQGPEVDGFEQDFASYIGVKHAIGVSDGTDAIYAACLALNIGADDEVIVPANSFVASATGVRMTGARPVFADCDAKTFLIDLASAEKLITPKTKAIVVVHLYGLMADMDAVLTWAKQKNLLVIEDSAQAHGARDEKGRMAGSLGDVGCFSFYPTKNLGAFGEAGAVVTNRDDVANELRAIRVHGSRAERYKHDRFGMNLNMDALQGGFLRERLTRLDAAVARRRDIATRYNQAFASLPLQCPADVSPRHAFHLYVVVTDRRDELKQHLQSKGIGSAVHYPIAIPDQEAYAEFCVPGACPNASTQAGRILSLPLFPEMTDVEVDEVIAAVTSFYG